MPKQLKTLFVGDGRPPEEVFKEGFTGNHPSLTDHVSSAVYYPLEAVAKTSFTWVYVVNQDDSAKINPKQILFAIRGQRNFEDINQLEQGGSYQVIGEIRENHHVNVPKTERDKIKEKLEKDIQSARFKPLPMSNFDDIKTKPVKVKNNSSVLFKPKSRATSLSSSSEPAVKKSKKNRA